MNWKLIILGGLAFYAAQWVVSMATGYLVHEVILEELYRATTSFWRPELTQVPPDMAALMPRWITAGLIAAFVMTAIYDVVRPAFAGPGWLRGVKYGVGLSILSAVFMLAWSGVFNLPDTIWVWWALEGVFYYVVGGVVLGWIADKLAPLPA